MRALGQRPAANRLDSIEQKVTAIEQRDREQVQQADRDRQHRGQMDKRGEARARHLAGHLGDADRTAELIGRFPSGEHAADIGQRALDDEPGLLRAAADGRQRPDLLAS